MYALIGAVFMILGVYSVILWFGSSTLGGKDSDSFSLWALFFAFIYIGIAIQAIKNHTKNKQSRLKDQMSAMQKQIKDELREEVRKEMEQK